MGDVEGGVLRSIRVAWWNLEILFDTHDDPISRGFQYTPDNQWTTKASKANKANLAAALNELHGGVGPELLVANVEGDDAFGELIAAMGNSHLKVVKDPTGTSDLRGIDVSLAYGNRKLTLIEKHSHIVHFRHPTRVIFEVVFELVEVPGQQLVVIANHWPSRRFGKEPSEPTRMAVAENISYLVRDRVPGVDRLGLLTGVGHAHWSPGGSEPERIAEAEGRDLVATAQACRRAGVPIREISVGSTRTAKTVAFVEGLTEIRPGTCIFNDVQQRRLGVATETDCATRMLFTVVAPRRRAVVIDAGRRPSPLTAAMGRHSPDGPGGRPALRLDFMAEEHGVRRVGAGSDMRIGDRLEVVAMHVCSSCVNMLDAVYGVWDGRVDRQIRVAARGRML